MSDSHQILLKSYVELRTTHLNVLKSIVRIAHENAPDALSKCARVAELYITKAEGKPKRKQKAL